MSKSPSKLKRYVRIIGYNLLVIFTLLCLIELGINYYLNNPSKSPTWLQQSLRSYYENKDRKIIQFLPECTHYSDALFYELNQGEFHFSNREFDNEYTVNSAGFRDDEASLNCPKIIALGDSYTMGWGVDQNESFPSLIEDKLGIKVLNTGVSSYGTAREVLSLKKVNLDCLQYLFIQYCPNDFNENKQFMMAEDSLVVSNKEVWDKTVANHAKTTDYYLFKHLFHIVPSFGSSATGQTFRVRTPSQQELKVSQERAFLNVLKKTEVLPKNVQIILFSLEAEHCHNSFITGVQKLLEKEHGSSLFDRISFVDLTGKITSNERSFLDPHLNKRGHEVVADALMEHFKELKLKGEKEYWYYDNGNLGYVCDYQSGLKHGVFKSYWDNGKLSRIGHFEKGQKEGEETNYTQNGWLFERKHYKNDVLSGSHLTFDSLGNVIDSVYY